MRDGNIIDAPLGTLFLAIVLGLALVGCEHESIASEPKCVAGSFGCECDDMACGAGLTCNANNACESQCIIGSSQCGCDVQGLCESAADECIDGTCLPRQPCGGGPGCACVDDGDCESAAICQRQTCRGPHNALVRVTGGDARSCQVTLLGASEITDLSYVPGVRGESWGSERDRVVTIRRTVDRPLRQVVAVATYAEPPQPGAVPVEIVGARCHGRDGTHDPEPIVTVDF